jgi:V/A-type H+-transporting ATPase subunit G/H
MSLETIKLISQTEQTAKELKASAQLESAKMIQSANETGSAAIESAVKRASDEVRQLLSAADEKAKKMTEDLFSENLSRQAAMRAKAEARLDDAARLVVERIVSS